MFFEWPPKCCQSISKILSSTRYVPVNLIIDHHFTGVVKYYYEQFFRAVRCFIFLKAVTLFYYIFTGLIPGIIL
jgi:hypothetical protein